MLSWELVVVGRNRGGEKGKYLFCLLVLSLDKWLYGEKGIFREKKIKSLYFWGNLRKGEIDVCCGFKSINIVF